jgi:pimeloyl-ACP methyl ester carboxylesterase
LRSLKINGTHLIGHHTGAAIAVEIAASAPLLVDRFVLFGVSDYSEPGACDKRRAAIEPGKLLSDGSQLVEIYNWVLERSPNLDPELVTRIALEQARAGEHRHGIRSAWSNTTCAPT